MRIKIVNETMALAYENGIAGVSIREVAKRCDIAVGSVYYYYDTKGELLAAVIEDFWRGAFADIHHAIDSDGDFTDKIKTVYKHLYRYLMQLNTNWLEQISQLKTTAEARQKEKEYFEKISGEICLLMDNDSGINKGVFTKDFGQKQLSVFIIENMMSALRKQEDNIDFLIELIRRLIFITK